MRALSKYTLMAICIIAYACCAGQSAPPMAQYPSPMKEEVRKHDRITFDITTGTVITLDSILSKPVTVYVPKKLQQTSSADLLIHFHGLPYVVAYAAEQYKGNVVAAVINLGSGSGVYANEFKNAALLEQLERAIVTALSKHYGHLFQRQRLLLSGFSAGYGAIRSILQEERLFNKVHAVLLLDGLHASYIPERKVLAEGGTIDSISLRPFVQFAAEAANLHSGKKFLFTHSEIFPGTFVSTTEAANYLLRQLHIEIRPVLKWGPGGMQQISEASKGNCTVMGFAGNSAPDHVDHFHNLYYFLNRL